MPLAYGHNVAAQEMKTGHFKGKLLFPNYLFL